MNTAHHATTAFEVAPHAGGTASPGLRARLESLERHVISWMARHAATCTRLSLGVIFFWFGVVKIVPGLSPAEDLAGRTILALTGGLVEPWLSVPVLAVWETAIGLGLMTGRALRLTLLLLFAQMTGTVTPVFLFPAEVFSHFPWVLTFEGQYIVKNLVLVSGALVVGAGLRRAGGPITDDRARPLEGTTGEAPSVALPSN